MTVRLRAVSDDVLGHEVFIRRAPDVSLILYNPRFLPAVAAIEAALLLPALTVNECDFLDRARGELPRF